VGVASPLWASSRWSLRSPAGPGTTRLITLHRKP
jgi:hypothetical protein